MLVEEGLSSKLDKLNDNINKLAEVTEAKKKEKETMFKLKWNVRSKAKKMVKKNKVLVFYLLTNRNLTVKIGEIKDDCVIVEGKPRVISKDYVYLYDGKIPAIVLPEWSMEPVGTKQLYDLLEADPTKTIAPQTIMIRKLEQADVVDAGKKKRNGKVVMAIIAVGIVIFYIMSKVGG